MALFMFLVGAVIERQAVSQPWRSNSANTVTLYALLEIVEWPKVSDLRTSGTYVQNQSGTS